MKAGVAGEWSTAVLPRPVTSSGMAEPALAVGQLVARAASPGFDGTAGPAAYDDPLQMVVEWSFVRVGHRCAADRYLAISAAVRAREYRRLAGDAYRDDLGRDAHRDYLAAV
jgi:hypothetical protein